MVAVWGLLILIVLFLYKEPKEIYMQEKQQALSGKNEQDPLSDSTVVDGKSSGK